MKLIIPSTKYQQSYLQAIVESGHETGITILNKPAEGQSFAEFVKFQNDEAQGLNLPEGWVPVTNLWLVDGNAFIGRVSIRHSLSDHLLQIGGQIGYWIRPSKRNKGYGKKILQLALPVAKKLGIKKLLITCDDTNTGSGKIIESNGGVLENIVNNGSGNPPKRRYWITLD